MKPLKLVAIINLALLVIVLWFVVPQVVEELKSENKSLLERLTAKVFSSISFFSYTDL